MSDYALEMEEQFEVQRKIEDCFDYVADFSLIKEWDHTVVDSEKVSFGAIGLGSQFNVILKVGLGTTKMDYRITDYDYPNQVVLKGEAGSFTAVDTVSFESIGNKTKVKWHAIINFNGIMAKVIPYTKNSVIANGKKTVEGLHEALKDNYNLPGISSRNKLADQLILPGIWQFTKRGYNTSKKHFNPISNSIKDKHFIITGASSGLGLATAKALAHRGGKLTLVARNEEKIRSVKSELIEQTGNENIAIEIADLSLMRDVFDLADRLKTKGNAVDCLINNAGALFNERKQTAEGLEMSFALLLLSPYILTNELMSLLQQSKLGRVVNVSSGGMYGQAIRVDDLESKNIKYNGSEAYARAKRGLVICTEEWAKTNKDTNVVFNAMHPGWADTPGVTDALPSFYKLTKPFLRTSEEGADTIVWLAAASECEQSNGLFYLDRQPRSTHLTKATKERKEDRVELLRQLQTYYEKFSSVKS